MCVSNFPQASAAAPCGFNFNISHQAFDYCTQAMQTFIIIIQDDWVVCICDSECNVGIDVMKVGEELFLSYRG